MRAGPLDRIKKGVSKMKEFKYLVTYRIPSSTEPLALQNAMRYIVETEFISGTNDVESYLVTASKDISYVLDHDSPLVVVWSEK
jgi:hypothetical protein